MIYITAIFLFSLINLVDSDFNAAIILCASSYCDPSTCNTVYLGPSNVGGCDVISSNCGPVNSLYCGTRF